MKILGTHTRVGTVQGLAWHSQAAFPQGSSAPSALWEPCAGMLPTPGAGEKNPHKKEDFLPSFFFFFPLSVWRLFWEPGSEKQHVCRNRTEFHFILMGRLLTLGPQPHARWMSSILRGLRSPGPFCWHSAVTQGLQWMEK